MAESLFTNQTPATPDAADGNTIVTATVVRFATAGRVTGIRWYGPVSVGVTCIGGLFTITGEAAGTELARANFGSITGGAWNTTTFASPEDVDAGTDYVAAVWTDHYVYTNNFFTAPLVNGNITGIEDNDPFHNGRYLFPAADLAFPPSTSAKSCYFVDVLFELAEITGTLDATAPAATAETTVTQTDAATLDATAPAATAAMAVDVIGLLGSGHGSAASVTGSVAVSTTSIVGAIT